MQMKLLNKRVGLFFGSFNPIHVGHLIVAETALTQGGIDELWFVVSPENPAKRKTGELEDANHRLEMVKRAIDGRNGFFYCDIEFGMPRPSYTADTLALLRSQNPDTHFSIVAGTDTQRKMGNYWKKSQEVLDHHDIIVYPRNVSEKDSKWELTEKAHSVSTYLTDVPQVDVSATYIRKCIQNNLSLRFLMPDSIIEYIQQNNLFKK